LSCEHQKTQDDKHCRNQACKPGKSQVVETAVPFDGCHDVFLSRIALRTSDGTMMALATPWSE
jgi:hypothetical protein